MAASENCFALELNEMEVLELLENATPGSLKKATKYRMKYFRVKTWKLYFDNLSIRVSQSKTMQVETIYTFKNYLYIAYPVSSHKIKSKRFVYYVGGVFNKTIIPLHYSATRLVVSLSSHIQQARVQ